MHIFHSGKIPHDTPDGDGWQEEHHVTFAHHIAQCPGGGEGIAGIHDDEWSHWKHVHGH